MLTTVCTAIVILYLGGAVLILVGVRLAASPQKAGTTPTLAVVVAARNEEHSIGACIKALRGQSLAEFEAIVVDDRSDDETARAAREAAGDDPRFRILTAEPSPDGIPPGKKAALSQGISQTSADILVFTDADCLPGPDWLKSIGQAYSDDTVLVAGYSPYRRSTWWSTLLAAEVASNAVLASALIGLRMPVMCTARNLSYRRSAYLKAGGMLAVAHTASGDDTLMLQRIASLKQGRIRYLFDPASHVPTDGPDSPWAFFRQKMRHFSTMPRYSPISLLAAAGWRSMDAVVTFLVPLAALGIIGPAPLWAFLAKIVADGATNLTGWGLLGERRLFRVFPLLELLHSPYILLGPIAAQLRRVSWK